MMQPPVLSKVKKTHSRSFEMFVSYLRSIGQYLRSCHWFFHENLALPLLNSVMCNIWKIAPPISVSHFTGAHMWWSRCHMWQKRCHRWHIFCHLWHLFHHMCAPVTLGHWTCDDITRHAADTTKHVHVVNVVRLSHLQVQNPHCLLCLINKTKFKIGPQSYKEFYDVYFNFPLTSQTTPQIISIF